MDRFPKSPADAEWNTEELTDNAGVPRSSETAHPYDLTVGLCPGPYESPKGGGRGFL